MGQGGYYTLVNATAQTWFKTYQHSYQMASWNFPDTVAPFSAVNVYVEFDESAGKTASDDAGECDYEVGDVRDQGTKFRLLVRFRWLGCSLTDFPVKYGPTMEVVQKGTELNFGWIHDGFTKFTLVGGPGDFSLVQNA